MGYEANYAGTSFVAPPEKVLGQLKFGSTVMNVQGDREQPGSLAAIGWDDEAVKPIRFDIIKEGIFVDYQTTREQATMLEWYYKKVGKPVRSYGCSYAQNWSDVQFQRMPNVSLLPGEEDIGLDEVIGSVERGIYIKGNGAFSIDQQRYNFQFGGQVFWEIRNGRLGDMLKDVTYQGRTPEFWNSMDLIGGPRSYLLGGAFNDGEGQPSQSNAVSHGCVPARAHSTASGSAMRCAASASAAAGPRLSPKMQSPTATKSAPAAASKSTSASVAANPTQGGSKISAHQVTRSATASKEGRYPA